MSHPLRFESKKRRICVAWVWNREGTEKLVNGMQQSVWFVPTGMKGLPQNVLLNFRLEFPKRGLTIYLPSGISEVFCQMVSTPGNGQRRLDISLELWLCNRASMVEAANILFSDTICSHWAGEVGSITSISRRYTKSWEQCFYTQCHKQSGEKSEFSQQESNRRLCHCSFVTYWTRHSNLNSR